MRLKRSGDLGRRKHYRLKATYLVCYRAQVEDSDLTHYNYTLTKDISLGGLMIMSEIKYRVGTKIEMIIRLPMYPDKKIEAQGEVTGSEGGEIRKPLYKTRIRFLEFDEQAFSNLDSFIVAEMQKIKDGLKLCEKLDRRRS